MLPVPVPVPGVVVVTVMKAGPVSLAKVKTSPSGSVAVIVWSSVAFSATVMSAGCVRVGARFDGTNGFTVTWKMCVSLSAPSEAWAWTVNTPWSPMPGATCTLPVVGVPVVIVTNVGPVTLEKVSASPSGSEPLIA